MVNWKSITFAATAILSCAQAVPTARQVTPDAYVPHHQGYIVRLKENSGDFKRHVNWVRDVHKRSLAKRGEPGQQPKGIEWEWDHSDRHFHGYAGEFDDETIDEIRHNEQVEYVEKDQVWKINDGFKADPLKQSKQKRLTKQDEAPWGLHAISVGHSWKSNDDDVYTYDKKAGKGGYAYVIDSGIRATHQDFEDRAESVWTAYKDDGEDETGHGTHVSGTIAGKKFGVAKQAKIQSLKIFDSEGSTKNSITLAALEWAIEDIVQKKRVGKAVINMSLGGPRNTATNDMIEEATDAGIPVIVSAGNEYINADERSPASAKTAITVGAVNEDWSIWVGSDGESGSNWGKDVDIFAPGVRVESADYRSDNGTELKTGTSMSCPHVAGIALYAMTVEGLEKVEEVAEYITDEAIMGKIRGNLRGSVNLQAHIG